MLRWGRTTVALAAGAVAAALIAGCGPAATGGTAAPKPNAPPAKPFTVAITPATGTANAPVSTELGLSGVFGKVTAITLTQAGGGAVGGNMRQDGTSWVPDAPKSRAMRRSPAATPPPGPRPRPSRWWTSTPP